MFFFGVHFVRRTHRSCGVVPADGGRSSSPYAQVERDGVGAGAQVPPAGVIGELSNVFTTVRATVSSFLDLISLETRRAGIALMWMVVIGLIAAICIGAAWLGLMAVIAMCAVSLGLTPIAAVIAVAVINLIAGAALIYAGIGISRDLLFSATRRQLSGKSFVPPSAP
jgi:uncharacterized membrane protein YqjE